MSDVEAVKAREQEGWSERAETYGLLTGQVTARLVEPLLDAAGVDAGTHLLDVGTGPGYAAQGAAERGAVATGVDIAHEVLAIAQRLHRGIRFMHGDAEELPFAERSFDALVSGFTINHVPRPERAIREFARVLRAEGGIAISTWDRPERNRVLGILVDAVQTAGVTQAEETPAGPDPYRFADDDEFRALLCTTGFEEVELRSVALTQPVPDTDALWEGMLGGSVRTAGIVMAQPPGTRRRIRAAADRIADDYRTDGGLAIPVRATIARGRRP